MVGPPVEIPGYDPTWNNTIIGRLRLQYQFFKLFICQCHAMLCQKCCTVLKMFYKCSNKRSIQSDSNFLIETLEIFNLKSTEKYLNNYN